MTAAAHSSLSEPIPVVRAVRSNQWRVLRWFSCSDDWQKVACGDISTVQQAYANHLSALGRGALMLVRPDGSVAASADAEVPA